MNFETHPKQCTKSREQACLLRTLQDLFKLLPGEKKNLQFFAHQMCKTPRLQSLNDLFLAKMLSPKRLNFCTISTPRHPDTIRGSSRPKEMARAMT